MIESSERKRRSEEVGHGRRAEPTLRGLVGRPMRDSAGRSQLCEAPNTRHDQEDDHQLLEPRIALSRSERSGGRDGTSLRTIVAERARKGYWACEEAKNPSNLCHRCLSVSQQQRMPLFNENLLLSRFPGGRGGVCQKNLAITNGDDHHHERRVDGGLDAVFAR